MTSFWSLAARSWPPSHPTHQLVTAVGPAMVAALLAASVLQQQAIRPWGTVPCTSCRQDARVIYEAGGAVAVCTGEMGCADEDLGGAPSRSRMNAEDFVRRLAAAFQLDGVPGRERIVIPLGRRKIGDEDVAVDLCTHPGRPEALEELARVAHRGPAVRVVVVPDFHSLPTDVPTELGGAELVWVGLNEVIMLDGGLRVDLQPILLRRPFRGVPASEFGGLALDSTGAWWRGTQLFTTDSALALALLHVLGERPGEFVPGREIWRRLWPEDHTRSGALPRGANPDTFDRRLRGVVIDVRGALARVGQDAVLGNQYGGAYGLVLPRHQVRMT